MSYLGTVLIEQSYVYGKIVQRFKGGVKGLRIPVTADCPEQF